MKKLLIALVVSLTLFSSCCGPQKHQKKRYVIEVTYFEGQKDTLSFIGVNKNTFRLKNGDLQTGFPDKTILSGVRQFEVLRVDTLGTISFKEAIEFKHLTIEKNNDEESSINF
jgi:hypothetical protein